MVVVILHRWPGWPVRNNDFSFLGACGVVVPPTFVGVLPSIHPLTVGFADVAWDFSLAKNCPHHVFPISELGRNVKEVDDRIWLPPSELVD
jgi:hypothetical protein